MLNIEKLKLWYPKFWNKKMMANAVKKGAITAEQYNEIVANQIAAKDDTIAQLRSRLAAADLAASQQAQNTYLVNQLRPPVNPAYVVTNPYAGTGTLPCQTAGCCGVSA